MRIIASLLKVATLCVLLVGCAHSPTGRNQLLLYSSQQLDQLGSASFNQIKQQEKLSRDCRLTNYVACVTDAVTAQVPAQYGITQWEVVVFDDVKQINAFALPGGKIGVYRGLLEAAKNQDQLAAVIGHEVAHLLAQHANERLSSNQLAEVGLAVANQALANRAYQQNTMAALGLGIEVGMLRPYDRVQESEADQIGLELMARAGFNPAQAITLWQNMGAVAGDKGPPSLLSTHPSNEARIAQLTAAQPYVVPLFQQAHLAGLVPQCKR